MCLLQILEYGDLLLLFVIYDGNLRVFVFCFFLLFF